MKILKAIKGKKVLRILVFFLALGFVFLVIGFLWVWQTRKGSEKAVGVYLAYGGRSLVVLERSGFGGLKVSGSRIFSSRDWVAPDEFSIEANFKKGQLELIQEEIYGKASPVDYMKEMLELRMKPSNKIAGDWNLTWGKLDSRYKFRKSNLFTYDFWIDDFFSSHNPKEAFSELYKIFVSPHVELYQLDPALGPFPSFLHKTGDERFISYFENRHRENVSENTLEMIREIAADDPNDPYISLHLIEMEAITGNLEKAERLWNKWNEANKNHPDCFLKHSSHVVFKTLCMKKLKKNHPGFPDMGAIFGSPPASMEKTLSWLYDLLKTDQLFFNSQDPLVPSHIATSPTVYYFPPIPNFLEFQVKVKVCRTLALFYLFQGRRTESLKLLASLYRLGQSLDSDGVLIRKLIGIAIRAISANSLKTYALNACETEEDLEECREMLSRLHNTPGVDTPENVFAGEFSFLRSRMRIVKRGFFATPNLLEAQIRHRVTDMKFQLVRMATAAKHCVVKKGEFPETKKDLEAFLGDAIPKDSFGKNTNLLYKKSSKDECCVYSVGPDKTDDKAAFSYDPTNGTFSTGDIFIRIPRQREFSFPREGVRAKNAFELLEQFPNGLPADAFADTKWRPFSIIESAKDQDLVIFSFGPDTDERDYDFHSQEVGKEGTKAFEPVPTPPPPKDATYGRSLQWVMRRGETDSPKPGYYELEPMYDPTNGTVSNGDIFIEIPKD